MIWAILKKRMKMERFSLGLEAKHSSYLHTVPVNNTVYQVLIVRRFQRPPPKRATSVYSVVYPPRRDNNTSLTWS